MKHLTLLILLCSSVFSYAQDPSNASPVAPKVKVLNPSNGFVTVSFADAGNVKGICVSDMQGNDLVRAKVNNEPELQITNLTAGTYLLTVFSKDNAISSKETFSCK
jgi:hypothetical protein